MRSRTDVFSCQVVVGRSMVLPTMPFKAGSIGLASREKKSAMDITPAQEEEGVRDPGVFAMTNISLCKRGNL
jgi:hypothetical protein